MIATLNSSDRTEILLESYIRTAVELGEITPAMEAQIKKFAERGNLSDRNQRLLQILHDALQDGCIQRVTHRSPLDRV
ncbi:MAG: hypothetical protein HC769_10035 [Cyanobacteria bacterium CRU_2_1]|nr:hypothetical protein [Cyanobacteria bacterium CRU_2_1]